MTKILVVEDEATLLKAITKKMEKMNIFVTTARSYDEARKNIEEELPDLIWLDHYLYGEKNGMELLKDIRKNDLTKNIPVIVVSNTCPNDKYRDYMDLGIDKYYEKSSVRLESIISDALDFVGQR